MFERASELRPGLPCPLCGRSLHPVTVAERVSFHCKSGHELPLADLLAAQSMALRGGLEQLLTDWRREHQKILESMEDARRNGFLEIAELFGRHARSLEGRIEVLKGAVTTSDTSKLLAIPPPSHMS